MILKLSIILHRWLGVALCVLFLLWFPSGIEATRYYVDTKTAAVVGTYSDKNWVNRWLYNHRPLWDIVVITFMVSGTALSMTSLILAWRAIGKKLRQFAGNRQRMPSREIQATEVR